MIEPSEDILDRMRTREVTGVFHSRKALIDAADDLLVAGFDRADIDVSAPFDELQRRLNYQSIPPADLAHSPTAARQPLIDQGDVLTTDAVAGSLAGCIGAVAMAYFQENEFIRLHGFADYGRWYLGINDEKPEQTKGHYEFPYGDFSKVHRCGVLSAESRAGQYQHYNAVAHLHGMLDAWKRAPASKRTRAASAGKMARGARHSAR
jgi:hypothetical protein